jgi:hypothetical protein
MIAHAFIKSVLFIYFHMALQMKNAKDAKGTVSLLPKR